MDVVLQHQKKGDKAWKTWNRKEDTCYRKRCDCGSLFYSACVSCKPENTGDFDCEWENGNLLRCQKVVDTSLIYVYI